MRLNYFRFITDMAILGLTVVLLVWIVISIFESDKPIQCEIVEKEEVVEEKSEWESFLERQEQERQNFLNNQELPNPEVPELE